MIPEGWTIQSGEDLAITITKGSSPNWQGFHYQDSGILFVTSENVRDGYLDVSEPKYLPVAFSAKERKSQLRKGDILINIVGASIGRSCRFNLEGVEANINQAVCVLRPRSSDLSDYIIQYLQSPGAIRKLLGQQSDSARPNLSLEDIRSFQFLVPPLAEQKRIAEILSTWDRAIERIEKLIANSEAQKKALMQQLLTGKKRLPGFDGEWQKTKLGNLGRLLKGAGVSRDDVQEAGFPAIRYGEIYTTHHYFIEEFHSFISPETAASSTPLRNGDILFTCSGETAEEIGKSVAFVGADKAFAGGDIIILRDHKQSPRFLGYALNSPDLIRQKTRFGQGNSVVHINARNLAELTLDLPEFSEQEAIGKALDAAKNTLIRLRLRLEKLTTEKSALMQQLLTGKRRVKIKGEAQAA